MKTQSYPYPFDPHRCIGAVTRIGAETVRINLPNPSGPGDHGVHGHRIGRGEVGEFIVIDCGIAGTFGRILEVYISEKERVSFELGTESHPTAIVQMLATIDLVRGNATRGVSKFPRLGSYAYSAHPLLVQSIIEEVPGALEKRVKLPIGTLAGVPETKITLNPDQLFGRHCAILGATGGGKSWTVASVLEKILEYNSKVILIDASGEYYTLNHEMVEHVYLGDMADRAEGATEVVFPYTELMETDLFAIFQPSGQAQLPKLRAAMKSLKITRLASQDWPDGVIKKEGTKKEKYNNKLKEHVKKIDAPEAVFDIQKLPKQIELECIFPTDRHDPKKWGGFNQNDYTWTVPLIYRVEEVINSARLECVFKPEGKQSLPNKILSFMRTSKKKVLRISLEHVTFAHNTREIVANAIGRYLLGLGRAGKFKPRPLLVVLDEAHQFLNKNLGDENNRYTLDAFGLIAKEGRKYSLTIGISTQRPRDIPVDVLSQVGTLVVHRLTNDKDRDVVERASGHIDAAAADFLPSLRPGEAIILGVDLAVPVSIQVSRPKFAPDSGGPEFESNWDVEKVEKE